MKARVKRELMNKVYRKRNNKRSSSKKAKGIKDPYYKGHITIVRG